jgi:hypothetical protein
MSEYKSSFFVVPSRILDLPGLTLTYLKIYETVFQFWNHGKNCYLSNAVIMARTGIKSESTIREAFMYFEKHGELIRKTVNNKRYLIQPELSIERGETNSDGNIGGEQNSPVANSTATRRQDDGHPVAKSTHNNKKINTKKINKDREAIPAEFAPNENHLLLACSLGIDAVAERDKFFDWATANGKKMVDWSAAFRNWLRKAHEFRSNSKIVSINKKESAIEIMRRVSNKQGWN